MLWEIIIAVAIIAVLMSLIKHIFKGLLKLVLFFVVVIAVIIGLNAFLVYRDVQDLKENFADSSKKIILMEDGKALTGLVLNSGTRILPQDELNEISESISAKDAKSALSGSYKLIVFDINAIANMEDEITLGKKEIEKEEALMILRAGDETERAAVFESLLRNNVFSSNSIFFFSQIKEGNIEVYQDTALFKAAKIIPLGAIAKIAKDIFSATKEGAETLIASADDKG